MKKFQNIFLGLIATGLALTLGIGANQLFFLKTSEASAQQIQSKSFIDVPNNYWAKSTIEWALSKGITKGYIDGTFKPNNPVTESEFLALLIRAYEPDNFNYIGNNHWADSYYIYAALMNYPTEGENNLNNRNLVITREHVAEIIAGTQGVNYQGKHAIHFLLEKGLAKGKESTLSIEGFKGEDTLTRAESVQFIKNVLEKGIKDENGKPIIKPRPTQPSDPNALKPLSTPLKAEVPSNLPEIGSVSAKELFDHTKGYAEELGYTQIEFVTNFGRYAKNNVDGVGFFHRGPAFDNGITVSVKDWNNESNRKLFKRLLENFGVDTLPVFETIEKLENNSGKQLKTQGITIIVSKKYKDNQIYVDCTVAIP